MSLGSKKFIDIFNRISVRINPWDVWKDFITMFACSISNALDKVNFNEREVVYMQIIHNRKYSKREIDIFPELVAETVIALEENPWQDFLGDIFMKLNLGNETGGQFFTPYHVCELMAAITANDIATKVNKNGYIIINDPCCGAGATLIAAIYEAKKQMEKLNLNFQNYILLTAQDIDHTAALMCYIQLSMLGMAAYVKIGDSLTEPIFSGDTLENYWFTPMYFSDVWMVRRLLKKTDSLFEEKGMN